MKHTGKNNNSSGFSIAELIIALTIVLIVVGLTASLFSRSLNTRSRESSHTDALTAAQAALNVLSRELANSGYGLVTNGIVPADSDASQLHFVSNIKNDNDVITDPGENITYFFEPGTKSILRHDANVGGGQTSIIINRISSVEFKYFDYVGGSPLPVDPAGSDTPTINTGRVRVKITVEMENVQNQVNPDNVELTSDVTLRNSDYMLRNY